MATVDTTFTGRPRSLPKLEIGKGLKTILERTEKGIGEFLSYPSSGRTPGSSETNWVPVDWFCAKIERAILKKRGERL